MITGNSALSSNLKHRVLVENPPRRIMYRFSRWIMSTLLVLSDFLSLSLATTLAVLIWQHLRTDIVPSHYLNLFPMLFFFALAYAVMGLYPAIGLEPTEELRRFWIITSVAFLVLGTLTFYMRNAFSWSRGVFGLAWIISLIVLPQMRKLIRRIGTRVGFWGDPVAIVGDGPVGGRIAERLAQMPELGLLPVVVIDGHPDRYDIDVRKARNRNLKRKGFEDGLENIQTAILVPQEVQPEFLNTLLTKNTVRFPRMIMVMGETQYGAIGTIGANPAELGGILGLEIRQNLFSRWQQLLKRIIDLVLVIIFSPLIVVCFGLFALAVRLDSPGKIFFQHRRIGKGGKEFGVWKFRTMIENAEAVLEEHLANDPELQKEWEESFKLKNDPRVTRVGRFLRRTSMDELPQIFNVLAGDMSLVGPRPIVAKEIDMYGARFEFYKQVLPGIAGLWQISGRNDLLYSERVDLDEYYVRNWSIWMDIYILLETIQVVLTGLGAY
jgi:Undecaprenyl-phosphate galactose phosphotransferase WbaP